MTFTEDVPPIEAAHATITTMKEAHMREVVLPSVSWLTIPADVPDSMAPVVARLDRAASLYLATATAVRDSEAKVQRAAAADRDAAAAAALDERKPPERTLPAVEVEQVESRRQLDIVHTAALTAAAEWVAATNEHAPDWIDSVHTHQAAVIADVLAVLAIFGDAVQQLRDLGVTAAWLRLVGERGLRLEPLGDGRARVSERLKMGTIDSEFDVAGSLATLQAWLSAQTPQPEPVEA